MISLAAISAASLGLKPRITSPLGTGNEAFGVEGRAGLVCSTIMSLKLGRGESVVSLLCLRIAEKRRKRKSPLARGAGPASKVFIRDPRERSHSNSRPGRVDGRGIPISQCFWIVSLADDTKSTVEKTRRPERICLISCTILARRGTHGHT